MKKIYVCGPTVYDKPHIGNLRPLVNFDIHTRALSFLEIPFIYIHNITDIDDKIIAKALKTQTSEALVSQKHLNQYLALMVQLNILKPTAMPLVSESIPGMVSLIEKLITKNFAYEKNGDVFFKIHAIKQYGTISNRKIAQMKTKSLIQKDQEGDFAIWKKTTTGLQFKSPWGLGRPGWHTECAFFIDQFFASQTIDVHGGGVDLTFPHHENENAQYLALNGLPITNKWIHNGHLIFGSEKMSKSLGNVVSGVDFIQKYGPDLLRMIFLKTSYSTPITIDDNLLKTAQQQIDKFQKAFIQAQLFLVTKKQFNKTWLREIFFDISNWKWSIALRKINNSIKIFNDTDDLNEAANIIKIMTILGFIFATNLLTKSDLQIYAEWQKLRKNSQYEKADLLREKLQKKGII